MAARNASPSPNSVVTSRNMIPGLGKSGIVRMAALKSIRASWGSGVEAHRYGVPLKFQVLAPHSPRSAPTLALDGRILFDDPCSRARLGAADARRCRSVPAQSAGLPARASGARRSSGTLAPAARRGCGLSPLRGRVAHAALGRGHSTRARPAAGQGAEPARRGAPSRRDAACARRRVQLLEAARPREPPARFRARAHAARRLHRTRDGRRALPALQRALRHGADGRLRDRRAPRAFTARAGLARGAGPRRDGSVELCRSALQERAAAAAVRAAGRARADRRAARAGRRGAPRYGPLTRCAARRCRKLRDLRRDGVLPPRRGRVGGPQGVAGRRVLAGVRRPYRGRQKRARPSLPAAGRQALAPSAIWLDGHGLRRGAHRDADDARACAADARQRARPSPPHAGASRGGCSGAALRGQARRRCDGALRHAGASVRALARRPSRRTHVLGADDAPADGRVAGAPRRGRAPPSPERETLADFRADPALVAAESEALAAAARIVTPHADIAALFGERAVLLDWAAVPARFKHVPGSRRIAFAGPTIARKGAYEVRDAARALDLEVVLLGSALEGADFWRGVRTTRDIAGGVAAFVQPAVIEDKPRKLLAALASGIPVIATRACGIAPRAGLTLVPACDAETLSETLKTQI